MCSPKSLSLLGEQKLSSSGISLDSAQKVGIYSVENARAEVHSEFLPVPALVLPYFDMCGKPVHFERGADLLPFSRVRYLEEAKSSGFHSRSTQRYAQLRQSGVYPYFATLFDWNEIAQDASIEVAIVEGELKALKACQEGLPTIGIAGVDCFKRKAEK